VFVDSKQLVVRLAGTQAQVDKAKALIVEILARKPREANLEQHDEKANNNNDETKKE
jgi:hypothetical protein